MKKGKSNQLSEPQKLMTLNRMQVKKKAAKAALNL